MSRERGRKQRKKVKSTINIRETEREWGRDLTKPTFFGRGLPAAKRAQQRSFFVCHAMETEREKKREFAMSRERDKSRNFCGRNSWPVLPLSLVKIKSLSDIG